MSSDDSDEDENKKLETIPDFVDEEREKLNEANIKTYADCRRDHDSKRFLEGNLQLVCEHTFTYLFNMYIELDMEDKTMRSDRCTHQVLIIKHILQIIQDLGVASKQAVKSFFERMKDEDGKYKQQFLNEFGDFQLTIYVRALKNNDDLMKQGEKEKRLGLGSLNHMEVFKSSPKEIQDCFESHDIAQLKQVLSRMIEEKRNYYLNQCITAASWQSSWETMTGGALVGNGEFSLRSRSKTLTLIKIKPYNISTYEDLYFAKYMPLVGGRVAPLEIAQKFSFEGHHYVNSMAIHKPFGANYDRICQFCPEANLISPFCRSQPSPYPFTT
ncbi:unnamed protein product [Rotaria sp. Silwood2]|nr:unnamed protein product [Rotaria sp. Silwood2]CAF3925890.1 unnamed protein product [Rotaria sp. Silwood2]CAF4085489.1 unnamed protein product [Rotaria sp. Silwood2]